jgi:hypothetical protein
MMTQSLIVEQYYGAGAKRFRACIERFRSGEMAADARRLSDLMRAEGSDKADWHNYPDLYVCLFSMLDHTPNALLEFGIGSKNPDIRGNMGETGVPGASLRAWRKWFPTTRIYGADYDAAALFDEDGIHTFYVDQSDATKIIQAWSLMPHLFFDVIVDDGAHTFEANSLTLDHTYSRLQPGGIYIVEDILVNLSVMGRWDEYFKSRGWDAVLLTLPHPLNGTDNAVALVQSPAIEPEPNSGTEYRGVNDPNL